MKEWTRKHHGYQPGTSPMHQNFTSYSTSNTPISRARKTASRSHDSCWISTHQTYHKFFLLFLSFSKAFSFFSLSSSSRDSKNVSVPLFLISMFFSTLLFIVPSVPILLLPYYITLKTPYHVNPINHPPPPHPWNCPFHHLHPHRSSLG